jgi:flagellar motor switch protein FliN/FliY
MTVDPPKALLDQMEGLNDVVITLRAELDQTTLTFAELLNLDVGSLVQLSRPTGENIDVYAEEALIGWGEVLLMDGTLTVRLADLRNARVPGLSDGDEGAPESAPGEES